MALTVKKADSEPKAESGVADTAAPPSGLVDTAAPPSGVAATLRRAREDHGQDLRTVAQVLRIRKAYLEAIEAGDFDQLPGTAYVVGFLRTYAEFLGLDGEGVVEHYKLEQETIEPPPSLVFPEPAGHSRIPGGAMILIAAVVLAVGYGGWLYLSGEDRDLADLMPAVPQWAAEMTGGGDAESGGASGAQPAKPGQIASFTPPEAEDARSAAAGPATESPNLTPPATGEAAPSDGDAPGVDAQTVNAPAETQSAAAHADEIVAADPDSDRLTPSGPETVAPETFLAEADAAQSESAQSDTAQSESAQSESAQSESAAAQDPDSAEPAPVTSVIEPDSGDPTTSATAQSSDPEPAPTVLTEATPAPTAPMAPLAGRPRDSEPSTASGPRTGPADPLLEETVVIPSPPAVPQTAELSTDRSPRVYGQSTPETRIVVRAVLDSWVQVRDRHDALLLTRVLRAGDSYFVPSMDGLTLLTGNAGGIEIEVDGVKVGPLGPVGAVRRQIALDPSRLRDGTALPR